VFASHNYFNPTLIIEYQVKESSRGPVWVNYLPCPQISGKGGKAGCKKPILVFTGVKRFCSKVTKSLYLLEIT